ncbi:Phosphate acetyltransferase [Fructilactobacillus florum 8D]|uniref:Phosphate acetyltransferase n=2 Tax=Fructilactobacillus florum TaxID=640331 RepID=W9EGE5_9LACO|nr:phosphate acetyltransferase [Fructilactobacillus florum]EKK20514.1 Phosphate acetyltransferase [Fructilactobacillus florum 2F]ETO40331.1 Phosphate acetyltransferase [Fructilactobacillus florum 8D]KRM92511.1 phosphate acetyltransferase [Fructilactobacillus florum DSM 22689 = JCM 16035]
MDLFAGLQNKLHGREIKLVFPEGNDPRIIEAASRLQQEQLALPVLLGKTAEIQQAAANGNFDLTGIKLIDPETTDAEQLQAMVQSIVDRRSGKTDAMQALEWLKDANYYGTTMVYRGDVDGMVSGAVHATGETVRPALQIIKTKPGVQLISGSFVMQRNNQRYLFADAAINIDPTAEQLAEIALQSGETARLFGIDPKVALLSFSTAGSAAGAAVEKVQQATRAAQAAHPDFPVDGELQFDAAFVPTVAAQKAPDSPVAGQANVFVFPELQSGNIGYKIAQRLGGFEAIGPILQGLNKPVSDLSRGCNSEDVYKVALITAAQAL